MADNLDDTKDDVFEPNAVNPKIERKLSQSEETQDQVRSKGDADEGEWKNIWLLELDLKRVKSAGSFLDGCKVVLQGFNEDQNAHLARFNSIPRLFKATRPSKQCGFCNYLLD